MTIDKNQAAMVEQSPLSEEHWRPDDDGTITIYWPAFFSEARDLLCLSGTVYTLAAALSVFVHKEKSLFCSCTCTLQRKPKPGSTFLWNRATRVKFETRSSDIKSRRRRSSAPVGTFLRAPFPLVPHCWKRCAWNNCGSVWRNGARKPFPCPSTRFSQCVSL